MKIYLITRPVWSSLLIFAQRFNSLLYRSIGKNASLLKKSFTIEKNLFAIEKPLILKKISFIKFLNPSLQEFRVVHWKPTNKTINFKPFNISVVSLKMIFFISWKLLVKIIFGVGCPLSSAKYAARNWISKLCGNAAFFQRNSETSSIETKRSGKKF